MRYPFLLYGSYGYTGALIVEAAVQRGLRPLLAGRDAARLQEQATRLGLEHRAFSLDDTAALDSALAESGLVLHCAGPFQHTSRPMVEACLRTQRHYLDITGEISVYESLAALDTQAQLAGVMLLPGVGFDVVPSDCLALHLKQRLPQATHLTVAIHSLGGGMSRGTALTGLEGLAMGALERIDGKLVRVPYAARSRVIDFGHGPVTVVQAQWGDLSTAYYSTGIPNIQSYLYFSPSVRRWMRLGRYFIGLAGSRPVNTLLKRMILSGPPGPSEETRRTGRSLLWAEVVDEKGRRLAARLETPEGYHLTSLTALRAVEKVLNGEAHPGFQTPARCFGADFVLEFDGVSRQDL